MFSIKCEQCDSGFLARRRIDRYCSATCRDEATARKARERTAQWRKEHLDRARQSGAEWRKANAERARNTVAAWHKANPEKRREHRAAWRRVHAEEIKLSKAKWFKANTEKGVIYSQRRRAKKVLNGGTFTTSEWRAMKEQYRFCCLCCGKAEPEIKLTIDHIIPITQGGSNSVGNIQPLCLSCNLSKGTKTADYRPA